MDRRQFLYALGIFGSNLLIGSIVGSITGSLIVAEEKKKSVEIASASSLKTPEPIIKTTSLVFHPDYFLFAVPLSGAIREHAERLIAIKEKIDSDKDLSLLPVYMPTPAAEEQIEYVHRKEYTQYIKSAAFLPPSDTYKFHPIYTPSGSSSAIPYSEKTSKPSPESTKLAPVKQSRPVSELHQTEEEESAVPGSKSQKSLVSPFYGATLSVGGALMGIDLVMKGQAPNAFSLIRPAGHHARPGQYKGFCIFNNVAIAARYAQKKYGVSKIMIIDWDVHHGNGTQEMFYDDPSVLYFSIHQMGIYPGSGHIKESGTKKGVGYNINAPMPARTGMKGYIDVFKYVLEPIAYQYQPELILISAGQDAHYLERIGSSMNMTDSGYVELTSIVKKWADELCSGRLVAVMEGGYNPKSAATATTAIIATLAGIKMPQTETPVKESSAYKYQLKNILAQQKKYWRL